MRIVPDVPDDADTGGGWPLRAQRTVKVPRLTIHHIYTKHQSSTKTRAQDTPGYPVPVSSPGPRSDQDSARVAVEVYFTRSSDAASDTQETLVKVSQNVAKFLPGLSRPGHAVPA